jgi:hypothetical protein
MRTHHKLAVLVAAIVALAAAAALASGDATDAPIRALEASLGDTKPEIDEVRITNDGVACIAYRTAGGDGRQDRGHAVVQGSEVLRSPAPDADAQKFEAAWSRHCLGPHGGMTIDQ